VVEIHAIGAGAVNQTIKAISIARRLVEHDEASIKVIPGFMELSINSEQKNGHSLHRRKIVRIWVRLPHVDTS